MTFKKVVSSVKTIVSGRPFFPNCNSSATKAQSHKGYNQSLDANFNERHVKIDKKPKRLVKSTIFSTVNSVLFDKGLNFLFLLRAFVS
jgi:hypothetical protein